MVKNFIFVNTEAIIIGMFTLIVETWLLVLMGLHFLSGFKEAQSIPIMKINFSRDSFYHSYRNTAFKLSLKDNIQKNVMSKNAEPIKQCRQRCHSSAKY